MSVTSGTERKRGFVGIVPCRSVSFAFKVDGIVTKNLLTKHYLVCIIIRVCVMSPVGGHDAD